MTLQFRERVQKILSRCGHEESPGVRSLLTSGITSTKDLFEILPELESDARETACWLLGLIGDRRAIPHLLRRARRGEGDDLERILALHAVGQLCGPRARKGLFTFLEGEADSQLRDAAVYALYLISDEEALPGLYEIVQDGEEDPVVRGQAAEAIGCTLGCVDRRRRVYREALGVLLGTLRDEAPEVRFWSAFALANIRAKEAIQALERVARSDEGVCPGWWAVKDEAADAIVSICGGDPPERVAV